MTDTLHRILPQVQKPARYVGGEYNQIVKDKKNVDVRVAFCFPDTYEIGMSNIGMRILYGLMNEMPGVFDVLLSVFIPDPAVSFAAAYVFARRSDGWDHSVSGAGPGYHRADVGRGARLEQAAKAPQTFAVRRPHRAHGRLARGEKTLPCGQDHQAYLNCRLARSAC